MTQSTRSELERRKVALELVSLVVPVATAVGACTVLVAHTSVGYGLSATLVTALAAAGCWTWHRHRHPATIEPPTDYDPGPGDGFASEEAEGPWDRFVGLLLTVAIVVGIAVVAITSRFLLALIVIATFTIFHGAAEPGDVVLATLCTLAVGLLAELGVVSPLGRRWNLDVDQTPGLSPAH